MISVFILYSNPEKIIRNIFIFLFLLFVVFLSFLSKRKRGGGVYRLYWESDKFMEIKTLHYHFVIINRIYQWNISLISYLACICILYIYRVSQKKGCSKFEGHFRPLNGRKSKKVTPKTPPKIQFYLLVGVFRLICGV